MFPNSPSLIASTVVLIVGAILTLGFAFVWYVFAATLVLSLLLAIHRSIPRPER
jgi:membrane protein implicated in regulation of membrane protease activity